MLQLNNSSPFKTAVARFPNAHGIDHIYLVVSATFELWPKLALSDPQLNPVLSDDYHAKPGSSSLRYTSELHLGKPTSDVILVGHAKTLNQRQMTQMDVGLRVAEREKVVRVFGERQWHLGGVSPPMSFTTMPLVYERAFGGVIESERAAPVIEERNPLGVGLSLSLSRPQAGDRLPNLEDPKQLLSSGVRPTPAAFGCIAPAWPPRRALAGTYDEQWQRARAPYLPADFQASYFNCASQGLIFDRHLQGGEPLLLMGFSERGPLQTALPICKLGTAFVLRGERHVRPNRLQTVLIEPDDNRMRLTFHADFPCDKVALQVEQVEVSLDSLELAPPQAARRAP